MEMMRPITIPLGNFIEVIPVKQTGPRAVQRGKESKTGWAGGLPAGRQMPPVNPN
jgi:hypothetical protein